jgi:hypothetical protein
MNEITSYPSVNLLIDLLLDNINKILGNKFLGMYIQGSLALKDFAPYRSDIDLVILTSDILQGEILDKLQLFHKKIIEKKVDYAQRLECIYIPIDSLRNYHKEKAYFPSLHTGGDFYIDGFGIIEKHILREKGIVIKGPDPESFIKPVNSNELKQTAIESLMNWWYPQLTDHSRLAHDDYQVYAVLTMCRALYTIQNGEIVSKSEAAKYAKQTIDRKWTSLIDTALSWKIGDKFNKLQETLDFMRFTLEFVEVNTKIVNSRDC